jgi:hypothetical protein
MHGRNKDLHFIYRLQTIGIKQIITYSHQSAADRADWKDVTESRVAWCGGTETQAIAGRDRQRFSVRGHFSWAGGARAGPVSEVQSPKVKGQAVDGRRELGFRIYDSGVRKKKAAGAAAA